MHNYVENISKCITNITNHFDQSIPSSILMWTKKLGTYEIIYKKKNVKNFIQNYSPECTSPYAIFCSTLIVF